jgi:Carboxypeptidase regulatory-like domain/TonB-dependent Receptor Plug Domain
VKVLERALPGLFPVGLLFIFALFLPNWSFAQLSTASVSGVVRDPSGAVVPNAAVTLRNVDTSVENTNQSNGAGVYAFLNITPGRYTLKATAPGFSSAEVPVFTLTVSQVAAIDFSLKLGSAATVVTVQGATPQLEASSASLGTVIATKQVNDLPLNGRNFTELLALTPGVSTANTGQNAGGGLGPNIISSSFILPVINGTTDRSNYYMTDGLDSNEIYYGTYTVPPIIDAIQEFKIVSHTDSAEFGSVLGGVINVVTKSGTNELHGSLWEYYRDQIFDARTYFLPTTSPKAPFHQSQFGGSIGGPVWIPKLYNGKDKTFFFGAYQGFRYSQVNDTPILVPTAAQLAGDESTWPTQIYNPFSTVPNPAVPGTYIRQPFPGNQIPSNLIDPRMIAYANFIFPPAGPVIDSAGDNYVNTIPTIQTQNEFDVRIDQKIGANDSAFFRYSFINSTKTSPSTLPYLSTANATPARSWGASYVHVFSPSLILQGQFSRTTDVFNSNTLSTQPITSVLTQAGFSPAFAGNFTAAGGQSLLPSPGITGIASSGEFYETIPKTTDSYQESATLTKTLGSHIMKFGGGFTSMAQAVNNSFNQLGFLGEQTADTNPLDTVNSGDPIASFILNVPSTGFRRDTAEAERTGGVMSFFAQDSWKATKRLTLNYGLRYDVTFIPPFGLTSSIGKEGGIQTGDMDFTNGLYYLQYPPGACDVLEKSPCIPGNGTLPEHVVVDPRGKIAYNTYTNFGPRLGFAFLADDKTVVRGAFGIVYDNWNAQIEIAQQIAGAWPGIGYQSLVNLNQPTASSPTPTVQAQDPFGNSILLPPATPFTNAGTFSDPHMRNPESGQYNLSVERLLSQSTTMTLSYVGSATRRLVVFGYYNTALTPGPGNPQARAPYTYMVPTDYNRSVGTDNYNALQFSLNRRYSNGLAYQVAYTWSKNMNIGDDGFAAGVNSQDPYALSAYGGRSVAGNNLTNFLAVNLVYQVPIGKGMMFSTGNHVLDYILGNWQTNAIFQAHSGVPFTPMVTSDIANTGNSDYEYANLVGNPNNIAHRGPAAWFNTAAYAVPPAYTYGTAGRNSLVGPAYWDLDGSLFRVFPLGEARRLEFRAEAFNLLNNVDLGQPANDVDVPSTFGRIDTTANTARELQLGARFIF